MINDSDIDKNSNCNNTIADGDKSVAETQLQHLAAAAMAESWMEKVRILKGERSVSANELTSLSALIVYVSHAVGTNEFRVERDLADRFNVVNVKCLPASRYDEAVRYLVDLVPLVPTA